jgi:hypothetical protein
VYSSGGQSAQTQATVFQTPDPAFTVTNSTAAPNAKIFTPRVGFTAGFVWEFGDGETSTLPNPTHQYKTIGTFIVTLSLTNGICKSSSTQTITVGTNIQSPPKTCGPLDDIISAFKGLNKSSTAALFKAFSSIYKPFPDVDAYFGNLSGITADEPAKQIDFFIETKTAALLDRWLTELNPLVQNSDVRVPALALWRLLSDLAAYIMCIQDGDFKDNKINLTTLFNKIEGFIKGWIEFVPNFSKEEKAQLKLLLDHLTAERDRVVKNGEDATKKNYMNKLNSCISMLTDYLK